MDETIEVSLDRIRGIIASLPNDRFSTCDVIREYCGSFCSNHGTPAFYSFNAQFGKLLKRNESSLGITEIDKERPIKDDYGHQTKTSYWQVNAVKAQ